MLFYDSKEHFRTMKKSRSFEKFGMNLVPLMYVDGQKAVNDGRPFGASYVRNRIYG